MTTEIHFPVPFYEVDSMEIVHHAFYPIWFDEGRKGYLKKAGITSDKLQALGIYLPLSKLACHYKSPAKFGDEIKVITKIMELTCVKVVFEYQALNRENDKVLAEGQTVHVWTNKDLNLLNIEKTMPLLFHKLKKFEGLEETS